MNRPAEREGGKKKERKRSIETIYQSSVQFTVKRAISTKKNYELKMADIWREN